MSAVNRSRTFPELVIQRTPALARDDLGVASAVTVFTISGNVVNQATQIANISGQNISQATQISQLSGNSISQATQIASVSAGLATAGVPRSEVAAVSAGLNTDIENLDLALTSKIALDCIQSDRITGAGTTVIAYLEVQISGATYRLALV